MLSEETLAVSVHCFSINFIDLGVFFLHMITVKSLNIFRACELYPFLASNVVKYTVTCEQNSQYPYNC